jgi:DNA polymerase-3 subunit beta
VVRLTLEPGGAQSAGRLTISSTAAVVGGNSGEVDGVIQGEGGQIALNVALLAEAIRVFPVGLIQHKERHTMTTTTTTTALKATVQQETLKRALRIVGHAVVEKSTLPVLGHILLAVDGLNRLKLTATDLHIGITIWLEAVVQEEGSITVPAKLLTDVVGSLPNETITLAVDSRTQSVGLTCGLFEVNIKGIEADEFPVVPSIAAADARYVSFAAADLRAVAEQVAIVAATDDSRPVLTGVLMRLRDITATFVASDGIRLAVRTLKLSEPIATPLEVIIPAPALRHVRRISGDAETIALAVASERAQIVFRAGEVELITRLIDGTYPNYERIMPRRHTTRAVLETLEFGRAVKLASYFAAGSANMVRLTLEPAGAQGSSRLTISANATDVGGNSGELDGTMEGEGGQIALNVALLAEAIATIATPQIALEIQSPLQPAVFTPVGAEGYVHIMTPMAVR